MSTTGDPTDLAGVSVAFGLQAAISLGLIAGFSFLRPRNKIVYEPRTKFAPEQKRPKPLKWYPTAWLRPTLFTDENMLMDKIGLDAVMFLRFLRFCFHFFAGICILGIPLCIFHYFAPRIDPISSTGDQAPNQRGNSTRTLSPELSALTMSNVRAKSSWFWLHASLVYVFSIYAYYLLFRLWQDWINFRRQYFLSQEFKEGYHNRTLLLTNLNESIQNPQAVSEFISSLGLKHPIRQVVMGRDVKDLPKLVKEHEKETLQIEDALATYLKDPYRPASKRPTHRINKKLICCGGESVDSISHCGKQLHQLEEEIYEFRSKGDEHFPPNASAFVSFNSITAAHSAASKLRSSAAIIVRSGSIAPPSIKLSPDFDNIIWENLGTSTAVRHTRRLLAIAIVIGVTIVWFFVVTFVSALTSLNTIQQYVPDLAAWIQQRKATTVILTSVIAPTLLAVVQTLPPIGFRYLARFQGVVSEVGVQKSVMHKVFAFLLYQYTSIFLVSLGATTIGSIFTSTDLGETSASILRPVAATFVDKSSFFIAMISTGMTTTSIELIQGVPLVMGFIRRKLFADTPRKHFTFNQPPTFPYGYVYAFLLTQFLLGICYSITAPLVVPVAALLFFLVHLVYKYQLMYVYETRMETGGSWWPKVFTMICICILAFHILTLGAIIVMTNRDEDGIASEGGGKGQTTMVFVALVLGVVFWWGCQRWLAPKGKFVTEADLEVDNFGPNKPSDGLEDDEELENRVYNPSLVKPLMRVWVAKEARDVLHSCYEPRYANLQDYMIKRKGIGRDRKQTTNSPPPSMTGHRPAAPTTQFSQHSVETLHSEDADGRSLTEMPLRPTYHHKSDLPTSNLSLSRRPTRQTGDATLDRSHSRAVSYYSRHPVHQPLLDGEAPPELEALAHEAGVAVPVLIAAQDTSWAEREEDDDPYVFGSGAYYHAARNDARNAYGTAPYTAGVSHNQAPPLQSSRPLVNQSSQYQAYPHNSPSLSNQSYELSPMSSPAGLPYERAPPPPPRSSSSRGRQR
ncbi:hypothetical protein DFS34DRAFT_626429 [Phlyctochytrium arcticum]|nr:hypothetical protein DFS34DRAFT_626429 [Phlyctochytrium arcticum]